MEENKELTTVPEQTEVSVEADAVTQEPVAETTPSRRDAFRERISKRYPDLNMDDEDAYYDQMGKTLDEYEGYEKNTQKLREAMERSPEMSKMLVAAKEQDNFDPLVYLFENANADILELAQDPEGSKKFGELRAKQLERQAENNEIQKAVADNMPASIEAVTAKAQEMGLDEEKTKEIVMRMFQIMDDAVHGKLDPEVFALLAKGGNFDEAVEQAKDEGRVEGLNTKVTDKLRTLENKQERVNGVQAPMKMPAPKKKAHNMFVEDDDEY